MRWKALAEIYTMHSFAPFSSLNLFVKRLRKFRHFFHNVCYFSVIFLDFFEILLKFCRNFWKFHGNPLNLQMSMNFRWAAKTQTQNRLFPVCPPPNLRWGFGGRRRTLPYRGGREKNSGRCAEHCGHRARNDCPPALASSGLQKNIVSEYEYRMYGENVQR